MKTFSRKRKEKLSLVMLSLLLAGGVGVAQAEQTVTDFTTHITEGTDAEYVNGGVKQGNGNYVFTKDTTITVGDGPITKSGVIDISSGDPLVVNAEGKTLNLISKGKGLRAGIASAFKPNKKVTVKAGQLNIQLESTSGLNRNYGIWFSGNNSVLNVEGNTNIDVKGTGWSYGVIGGQSAKINLQGVTIRTQKNATEGSAIKANASSTISVNVKDGTVGTGPVDIEGDIFTYKHTTDDGYGTVTVVGPSTINLALTTTDSQWKGVSGYELHEETDEWEDETTKTEPGNVNLWVMNGGTWTNEKVNTQKWQGFAGSLVTKLTGGNDVEHSGIIYQKDGKPLTIGDYAGHVRINFDHDAATPTHITGGDVTIKTAAPDSGITLRTDSEGITMTDETVVGNVLNALAGKLYYTGATTDDTNLTGKVEIAEGLTAQSAAKSGDITFNKDKKGQGEYKANPQPEVTGPITETTTLTADRTVNWNTTNVTEGSSYVSTLFDEKRVSTKGSPMVVDMNGNNLTLHADSKEHIPAAIYVGANMYVEIKNDSSDKKLSITATNESTRSAKAIVVNSGHLTTHGTVEIKGVTSNGRGATAISMPNRGSAIVMNGDLIIDGVQGLHKKSSGVNTDGIGVVGQQSSLTVNGNVKITNVKGSSLKTSGDNSEITLKGGDVSIEAAEDTEKNKNYYAAFVEKGATNINVDGETPGTHTVNILGDMYVTGQYGKRVVEYSGGELADWKHRGSIRLALVNDTSAWKGVAAYEQYKDDYASGGYTVHDIGDFQLYLQNGATWTNEAQSHVTRTTITKGVFEGSHIMKFTGGADQAHRGVIIQKDDRPLILNQYAGNTLILYKHDMAGDTSREHAGDYGNKIANFIGGDTKVLSAEDGSVITLRTDATGLNTDDTASREEKNLVNDTLNCLANKLWYEGKDGKLSGKVEIAEGLTAQSASQKIGDMSFQATGQGEYPYVLEEEANPDAVNIDTSDVITFGYEQDKEHWNQYITPVSGNTNDLVYEFGNDGVVTITANPNTGSWAPMGLARGVKALVHAKTLNLKILEPGMMGTYGIYLEDGDDVTINSDVNINVSGGESMVAGINMSHMGPADAGKTDLTVNGNLAMRGTGTDNTKDEYYGIRSSSVNGGDETYTGARWAPSAIYLGKEGGSTMTFHGDVDITVKGNGAVVDAYYKVDGQDSLKNTLTLQGGRIETATHLDRGFTALGAYGGTINMNMNDELTAAADHDVTLIGHLVAMKDDGNSGNTYYFRNGRINLGLNTAGSSWDGLIANSGVTQAGEVNLYLANGATWKTHWGMPM